MRPPEWRPPIEPSLAEQTVMRLVRRAKLFVFLREHRHELFDEGFQAELAAAWTDSPTGRGLDRQPQRAAAGAAGPAGVGDDPAGLHRRL
jgi:hypothetical protein